MTKGILHPRVGVGRPVTRVTPHPPTGGREPRAAAKLEGDRGRPARAGVALETGGRAVRDEHERRAVGLDAGGRSETASQTCQSGGVSLNRHMGNAERLREPGIRLRREIADQMESVDRRGGSVPARQEPLGGRYGESERVLVGALRPELTGSVRRAVEPSSHDRARHPTSP